MTSCGTGMGGPAVAIALEELATWRRHLRPRWFLRRLSGRADAR